MKRPEPLARELRRGLKEKRFADVQERLASCDLDKLTTVWSELTPFERIVLFKLFPARRALSFFKRLNTDDQFLLFATREPGALGPVIETARGAFAPGRVFHRLSDRAADEMARWLTRSPHAR